MLLVLLSSDVFKIFNAVVVSTAVFVINLQMGWAKKGCGHESVNLKNPMFAFHKQGDVGVSTYKPKTIPKPRSSPLTASYPLDVAKVGHGIIRGSLNRFPSFHRLILLDMGSHG
jgi:hypothetical protein